MSTLKKLMLVSKKSLSCFIPNRMADTTHFSSGDPEELDDEHKPNGVETVHNVAKEEKVLESKHEVSVNASQPPESLGRQMVSCAPNPSKCNEPSKPVEEEEILEIKTPGFVRLFGRDTCEYSNHGSRHEAHNTSSDGSEDDSSPSSAHQPPHLPPTVHLRVPMKDEHDVHEVVAALKIKGVSDIACDLANQIVKVTGTADPDRLLKKVKKVKPKSKIISYSNPLEIPPTPESFSSSPPPSYAYHRPTIFEAHIKPPPRSHVFTRDSYGPYGPPLHSQFRPNSRPPADPMYYEDESSYPPNVRPHPPPPPPPPVFYGDDSFYPDYVPSNLSSSPHSRRSTSPPRRRSYFHERNSPNFGPPPMNHPGGPAYRHGSNPWSHGVSYWMDNRPPIPVRMQRMYY
ncbi:uncharacterized protein [Physcomitrium patens]|uniref:HMA domain-containing protein n=2 Tax=Physcomitrium patens TaxID=3218 RepID=A0A2K1JHX2_PHYPA|nr:uncharacterized protein P8B7.26-like [Physcomitrium patens]PNR41152.1 hypothetical protein PHYPA_018555 [Physcomitrium patens]|eukprot:XP_024394833.1 uncharacterized protein P8B7.26-like [Physcomitrella patens]